MQTKTPPEAKISLIRIIALSIINFSSGNRVYWILLSRTSTRGVGSLPGANEKSMLFCCTIIDWRFVVLWYVVGVSYDSAVSFLIDYSFMRKSFSRWLARLTTKTIVWQLQSTVFSRIWNRYSSKHTADQEVNERVGFSECICPKVAEGLYFNKDMATIC